jgi:hypothetical protein
MAMCANAMCLGQDGSPSLPRHGDWANGDPDQNQAWAVRRDDPKPLQRDHSHGTHKRLEGAFIFFYRNSPDTRCRCRHTLDAYDAHACRQDVVP